MSLEFANGVIIDGETNVVTFPVGPSLVLKLTFEEWVEFVLLVNDANLVFETNTAVNTYTCNSCGVESSSMEFEEPGEDEFN
jgi:hypothetical protein